MAKQEGQEKLCGKVVIEGELTLLSPLLIGDGAGDSRDQEKDIHVLRDSEGRCLIPGTSLAGVLRAALAEQSPDLAAALFGELGQQQSAVETYYIVFPTSSVVFRDGVSIDPWLGTARDGAKYDYEAVERGARAPLCLVITLRGCHTEAREGDAAGRAPIAPAILDAAAFLRDRLADGIHLGAMTAKGLGLVRAEKLVAGLYDFRHPEDVKAWLSETQPRAAGASRRLKRPSALAAYVPDTLVIEGDFALRSSLLIRSYETDGKGQVAVSRKSGRDAVIPGSTLKGVLRHRALHILEREGRDLAALDRLMGTAGAPEEGATDTGGRIKSRLRVSEVYIDLRGKALTETEVTRNRIDRFTGGTIDTALFRTKPLYQKEKAPTVHLKLETKGASDEEAGLMLFLLRDLWQGRLALGGETGVGRGTLQGLSARIRYGALDVTIPEDGRIGADDRKVLQRLADAFTKGGRS